MTHVSHSLRLVAALLLWMVLGAGACGAELPGGTQRFAGPDVITAEGVADIRIVASVIARVATVRPIPDALSIPRGGVVVFTASAEDANGRFLSDVEYRWRMRDPLAGTVTVGGVFTAGRVPGAYADAIEVTAVQRTAGGEVTASGSASMTVTAGIVDTSIVSVSVFPSTATARMGDRIPLRAAAFADVGGLVHDVDLVWRVVDPTVGAIDENGLLTVGSVPGLYRDVIEVRARRLTGAAPPVVGRASVQVLSAAEEVGGVRAVIGPLAVIGKPGDSFPLIMLVFDFQGRPLTTGDITWQILDDVVGTVDPGGRFTLGDTPGAYPASVRASTLLTGRHAGVSLDAHLDVVVQSLLTRVAGTPGEGQLLPDVIRMRRGEHPRVSLLYYDAEGSAVITDDVGWEFDAGVVTMDERGRATAVGPPGVYPGAIRGRAPGAGARQTAEATVVILGPLVRVDAAPRTASLRPADLLQFTASAYDEADNRLFDVGFMWELAEGAPGSITATGLYQAGDRLGDHPGSVRVTATQRQPK